MPTPSAVWLAQPMLPTHDRDLVLYAIGSVVLLVVGIVLIVVANRRKR